MLRGDFALSRRAAPTAPGTGAGGRGFGFTKTLAAGSATRRGRRISGVAAWHGLGDRAPAVAFPGPPLAQARLPLHARESLLVRSVASGCLPASLTECRCRQRQVSGLGRRDCTRPTRQRRSDWQTTTSKLASSNGRLIASAGCHRTGRQVPTAAAPLEHRRVQIGGDDLDGGGQRLRHRPRDHAGAGSGFEHPRRTEVRHAARQVGRIGLEHQRHEKPVAELVDRAGEKRIGVGRGGRRLPWFPTSGHGASIRIRDALARARAVIGRKPEQATPSLPSLTTPSGVSVATA